MKKGVDLEQIYLLYMQDIYRYVYSLCNNKTLAEDIVQETFYRAYYYLDSYKKEKIKPWLFKVAYHTFIDIIRKEKKVSYYEDLNLLDSKVESKIKSAEEEFLIKDRIEYWLKTLETLPIPKGTILLLRDYYHFSYQEIAEMFDMTIAKVKITIFRARKEMQKKLESEN